MCSILVMFSKGIVQMLLPRPVLTTRLHVNTQEAGKIVEDCDLRTIPRALPGMTNKIIATTNTASSHHNGCSGYKPHGRGNLARIRRRNPKVAIARPIGTTGGFKVGGFRLQRASEAFFDVSDCLIVQLDTTHLSTWELKTGSLQVHSKSFAAQGDAAAACAVHGSCVGTQRCDRHCVDDILTAHCGIVVRICCKMFGSNGAVFWHSPNTVQRPRRLQLSRMMSEDATMVEAVW